MFLSTLVALWLYNKVPKEYAVPIFSVELTLSLNMEVSRSFKTLVQTIILHQYSKNATIQTQLLKPHIMLR
jgi:hypothetical protein